MKKTPWTNKRFGKKKFVGQYEFSAYKGTSRNPIERTFVLVEQPKIQYEFPRRITFESWQAAYAQGWRKV